MAKDREYKQLIHAGRWLRLRRAVLTEHPVCERCQEEGRLTAATEVHHVRPVEEGYNYTEKLQRMYDRANLRALCHDCHVKTHTELGRSGREATKKRNAEQVAQINKKFFGDESETGGPIF